MDYSNTPLFIELKYMGGTLGLAKESFDLFEYLEFPPTASELLYIENSAYFRTIKDALWCNCCVDLAKLYYKSETTRKVGGRAEMFSLQSILNSLKAGKYHIPVDFVAVKFWLDKIESNIDSINLLKKLRDKVYSHTELYDFSDVSFVDLFSAIKNLFVLAFDVFSFLWTEILGRNISQLGFTVFDPNNFDIIRKLSE